MNTGIDLPSHLVILTEEIISTINMLLLKSAGQVEQLILVYTTMQLLPIIPSHGLFSMDPRLSPFNQYVF